MTSTSAGDQQPAAAAAAAASTPSATRDYYQLLGIERTADQTAIKKAYRRLALRLHPDKTGNDPALGERFQLIQKAYETLSDERKRTVYDTYGERGAAMFESMSEYTPFVDPDMIAAINSVFLGGSLLIALLIMFPSFLSVRADGRVQWSWVAVFAPLFIVDLAIIILVLRSKMPKPRNPREGMDDSEEDQLEDTDTANARAERIGKTLAITYMACFTLFQILIALRLDETITASWAIICIPWFVLEFAHLILKCVTTLAEIQYNRALSAAQARRNEADPELPQSPKSIFFILFDNFGGILLRFVQIALILLKIDGVLADLSWPIVFLPTWLLSAVYFISLAAWAIRERQLAAMAGSGTKSAEFGKTLTMRVVVLLVYLAMLYTGIGLLVTRLGNPNGLSPSTAVILIPVFIVLSILFCCCCCCLPTMFGMMRAELRGEMMQPTDTESAMASPSVVSADRRIEASNPTSNISVENSTATI